MKTLPGFILACILGLISGLALNLADRIEYRRQLAVSEASARTARAKLADANLAIKAQDRRISEIGEELNACRTMREWDRFEEGRAR